MKGQTRLQRTRLAVLVALAAGAGTAFAASGQFTFVVGEVTLTKANGQRVVAARGLDVDAGDQIVTGTNGMAQLTMVDQARLSLRPNSQFRIESYAQRPDGDESALLSLVRGTLRTFTGLIASRNRDKFVMKTRVATVGIRGSGNILFAGSGNECTAIEGASAAAPGTDCTVNHTMEGAHAITNVVEGLAPGLPPQQGGAQTLITGPGQTVLVQGNQPPRYIPTPQFIADTAINPLGQAKGATDTAGGGDTRNFGPGDNQNVPPNQQGGNMPVGNNGLGFVTIDASSNVLTDPASLHDVVIANGSPIFGQATQSDLVLESGALRGYSSYPGSQSGTQMAITGGTLADTHTFSNGGASVSMGRWNNASLGFFGPGSAVGVPGAVHWIYSPSGYPTYLSEVLTGTATYTLVAATSPTNQNGTAGTLGSATINVNFSARTLGLSLGLSVPAAGGNAGGSWQMTASNVPLSLNTFYASTADRLVIANGTGQSSSSDNNLYGSVDGSLIGSSLQGAILGYGITDQTSTNPSNHQVVSGVAGFSGAAQDAAAAWREGRVGDPAGLLSGNSFLQSYATTNRPAEVTQGANGAVTAFAAPYANLGGHAQYALGTGQVVQSGLDAETGMVWGRWGGGAATVSGNGQTVNLNLQGAGLHYIFSGAQQGPVALPLTGTATYDVIGSTSPTDPSGHVGTLNSASLDANFTNRTVNTSVNVGINGQTWLGSAVNVPIYRDQYFSAAAAPSVPGAPSPANFAISCSPSCGQGANGSLDGFFAGRTGNRAGVLYNMGGVQGAVAFGRRGG